MNAIRPKWWQDRQAYKHPTLEKFTVQPDVLAERIYRQDNPTSDERSPSMSVLKAIRSNLPYDGTSNQNSDWVNEQYNRHGYSRTMPTTFNSGGAVEADIENEKTISEMGIDQFGQQADMIRKQNLWTNEEMYGPLKAVKYK